MSPRNQKSGDGQKHSDASKDASKDRRKKKARPVSEKAAEDVSPKAAEDVSQKAAEDASPKTADGNAATDKKSQPPSLEEQVSSLTDRLQRKTAEFANYQKRIHKEMEETRKYALKPLALDLLAAMDSLERALNAFSESDEKVEERTAEFLQGFRMIHDQLNTALANHGIVAIQALDQPFDPNCHDAVMEEQNPDLPDRTVIDELVKGYMLHDRLLRPARVRVSRNPKANNNDADGEQDLPEGEIDRPKGEKDSA